MSHEIRKTAEFKNCRSKSGGHIMSRPCSVIYTASKLGQTKINRSTYTSLITLVSRLW